MSIFSLGKLSLIILTRCNLKCRLCCEYVPQNKAFPDMTVEEEKRILAAVFNVCDHVNTLHLTGGGEPFLHPKLPQMIDTACQYADRFDKLMLFTNSTIPIKQELIDAIVNHKEIIVVQLSQCGINPELEQKNAKRLVDKGVTCKIEKYYGDAQSFGGWVDFGKWEPYGRNEDELEQTFKACSVTRILQGNWRTRDGKIHWCSRSQRGMELGLLPSNPNDYVDLFDGTSIVDKRRKFQQIAESRYISACNYCTGDAGTTDNDKRFKAAEQMK